MICPLLAAAIMAGKYSAAERPNIAQAECIGPDCAWWSSNRCAMTAGRYS